MNILGMVSHMRSLAKSTRSLPMRERLVANTNYALSFFADEGNLLAGRKGLRAGAGDSSLRGFFGEVLPVTDMTTQFG